MSTVIIKWNPAFSSYSMLHFLDDIRAMNEDFVPDFNWSIWDYEQTHKGDRLFWLKVGWYGQTGIVGSGTITSEPYKEEDWSGKGRTIYYVDYDMDTMINPDALPILTAKELSVAIPDFEWTGGHSGIVLDEEQANIIDALWTEFLERNNEAFVRAESLNRGDKDLIFREK